MILDGFHCIKGILEWTTFVNFVLSAGTLFDDINLDRDRMEWTLTIH